MSNENDRIETTLAELEKLDEEASLEEKNEALEAFAEAVIELPAGTQALVLDDARELLTWVSAPARTLQEYVDQASDSEADGEQDTSGQSLGYTDPTPAEEPVDGSDLLREFTATFRRYVALPDGAPTALALWTLFNFCFREFTVAPILAITSPTKRCGKSTLLHVLEALVSRPQMASNITAAAIYRVVEGAQPTLLIDEADSFMRQEGRHRNILNAGHLETGEVVLCSGDQHDVRRFSAFGPKAIARIGNLPPTLDDRSISLPMRRKAPGEEVQQLRLDQIRAECRELRQRMVRWVQDHRDDLDTTGTDVPDELDDRAADNWRPLMAIAELIGGLWFKRAASSARLLSGGEQGQETETAIELLHDIHTVFSEQDVDRIPTETLLNKLADLGGRPWATWSNGDSITDMDLARLLRPFGIRPKDYHFSDKHAEVVDSDERDELPKTLRGYEWQDFEESFLRYRIIEPDNLQEAQEAA